MHNTRDMSVYFLAEYDVLEEKLPLTVMAVKLPKKYVISISFARRVRHVRDRGHMNCSYFLGIRDTIMTIKKQIASFD